MSVISDYFDKRNEELAQRAETWFEAHAKPHREWTPLGRLERTLERMVERKQGAEKRGRGSAQRRDEAAQQPAVVMLKALRESGAE